MIHPRSLQDEKSARIALGDYRSYWVTPAGVLAHLAQWAAPRPFKAQPNDDFRRLTLGAANALAEAIQRLETQSGPPWDRALPIEASVLASLMGVSITQAQKGLEWLDRVGVSRQDGRGWIQIDEALWEPAPVLATVAWDRVRERLRKEKMSLAPELALVRALALRTTFGLSNVRDRESEGWCSISYTELVELTLFQRSAVMRAMAVLQTANILEQDERSGRCAKWRLMPAAFGQAEPLSPPAEAPPDKNRSIPHTDTVLVAATRTNELQDILIQVAGLSLTVPVGTHVRVTVDDKGHRSYHIGDHLIVGPVE